VKKCGSWENLVLENKKIENCSFAILKIEK
jgi:hypothetical protein